jgi:HSP20 family molecular chaperone IbpA
LVHHQKQNHNQALPPRHPTIDNSTLHKIFNHNSTHQPNNINMSFFPRAFASEFAPIFHLLDDYAAHNVARSSGAAAQTLRSFQPKFDIKENKDSYELHGELPGVQRENLSIEFVDSQTLAVKGRTESHREEGTRPSRFIESATPAQGTIEAGSNASTSNTASQSPKHSPKKAYVEDEDNFVQVDNAATTASSAAAPETSKAVEKHTPQQQPQRSEDKPTSRYWLSERSVGTFARSFQFPSRVDQDNVKASLENGILSIVVPKSVKPEVRRINIE